MICFVLFCFVFVFVWKILKKEKRENERKKRVEMPRALPASRIFYYIVKRLFFLFFLCACLCFFFFVSRLLFFLMPRIMWSSRWSSSAVFAVERGVHGRGSSLQAPKPAGQGSIFDLMNTEGEPLPIECIGLSNPLVGVDVLMF